MDTSVKPYTGSVAKWILNQIKVAHDFYGKITFSFEKGKLTYVKKEETLKPPKEP